LTSDGNSSIDCATARQHLSAFHDGELAPNLRTAVREHIEGCPECAARLAEIRELSRMAAEMPTPAVPVEIWPQLEKKLATELPDHSAASSDLRLIGRRRVWIRVAAAALVVVTVSTAAVVWLNRSEHGEGHVVVNFGRYLDEFQRNPDAAQQVLLSNYEGRAVSYDEAATQVRYQPATPERLPNGLSRKAVYLLRMPCCTCVQAIYQGAGGEKLAVFEHMDDQPVWFGNRPTIQARCNGMSTSLVEVDDRLAASWKRHGRCVTVIGARDVEQVAELIAYLDDQRSGSDRK
jgi:anti-sigma factor RsiW